VGSWAPQLVKVRCGLRGSGWAIGRHGVLTAWHVVAPENNPAGTSCKAVTGGRAGSGSFICSVVWHDPELDLAILEVDESLDQRERWADRLAMESTATLADAGEEPLEATAVGFPDSMLDAESQGQPVSAPDQVVGQFLPSAGLAEHTSFDISTTVPMDRELWKGFSGAVVRTREELPRVVGVVIERTDARANRRLTASKLPAPAVDARFAEALIRVGASPNLSDRNAPLAQRHLRFLHPSGRPYLLRDVPSLSEFGVRRARGDINLAGDPYFPFVDRDESRKLRTALINALGGGPARRFVVLVGEPMAGKSRLAAEVVRGIPDFGGHRFVCPDRGLRLRDLPPLFTANGPVLLWLDDMHDYLEVDLDLKVAESLLLNPKLVAVGTLRADKFRELASKGYQSAARRMMQDEYALVARVELLDDPKWSSPSSGTPANAALQAAMQEELSLGEYLSALRLLSDHYQTLSIHPRVLVDCVADWARVGIARPFPEPILRRTWADLLPQRQKREWDEANTADRLAIFDGAVADASRKLVASASLVRRWENGLTSHEVAQKLRHEHPVARAVWDEAALYVADDPMLAGTVGLRAAQEHVPDIAAQLWEPLSEGDSYIQTNLSLLQESRDPGRFQVRRFYDGGMPANDGGPGFAPDPTADPKIELTRFLINGRQEFAMTRRIAYRDRIFGELLIPGDLATFRTDLASVPSVFKWLVPRTYAHLPAGLLHDALISPPGAPPTYIASDGHVVNRVEADRVFRDAMGDTGTSLQHRWLVWSAVTLGTIFSRDDLGVSRVQLWRYRMAVALSLVAISYLGLCASFDLIDAHVHGLLQLPWMGERPWWAEMVGGFAGAVAIPFLLGLTWGRFRVAGWISGITLSLVSPAMLYAMLLAVPVAVYRVVNFVIERSMRPAFIGAVMLMAASLVLSVWMIVTGAG